jgi:translation initiation factor IF-2
MSRFSKGVTVEVVKKKRRHPFNLGALQKLKESTESTKDKEVDHVIDLVKKNKQQLEQKKASAELAKIEESKKPVVEVEKVVEEEIQKDTPVTSEPDKKFTNKAKDKGTFKESDKEDKTKFKGKLGVKSPLKSRYDSERRRGSNKVLVQNVGPEEEREKRSFASIKRAREKARKLQQGEQSREKQIREVILPEVIVVADLASRMSEKGTDVIKELMKLGIMTTLSQTIDADTAEIVIHELGHKVKRITEADVENILIEDEEIDESKLVKRSPIVTIVGHVDHGKTSLLDALRETDVISGEAGGITQHIGAYQVTLGNGENITFIDTPGHEAFTSMRLRGVNITDIVVLVVAADDGIKEQTVEAINHAKAAKVPIIVAINKIDKEGADPSKVSAELLSYDLIAESMGGDVMTVEVSALQKLNLEKLEEAILLQAELLELKTIDKGKARGVVIESRMDKSKGVIATLLVQKGRLKKGDIIVAGAGFGKAKTMVNDRNRYLDIVTPSIPVEVTGLDVTPDAGDNFAVVDSEKQAKEICEYRKEKAKKQKNVTKSRGALEELFMQASNQGQAHKVLPVIIKGDVQGSIEAISGSLNKIEGEEIDINILHKAIGGITESDVTLAKASKAIIFAFNTRAHPNAKLLAEKENIDIRYYSIIYELIDDAKRIMSGMLEPLKTEKYLGKAEIRQVFNVSKVGKVGGSFVTDGVIKRGAGVRLIRDDIVIHEGKLKTLKRFKEDAKEVTHGYECGVAFERYDDIKEGDAIEAYEVIEKKREIL